MFGQNKPTGFSGFGTSSTTFGSFGSSSSGFGGGSAFGTQTPASSGLFGSGASASAAPSLFGQSASTGFGQQPSSSGFSFGTTPSTSGGLFGSTGQAGTSSLFSTPAGSGSTFGAKPGGFGGFGGTTNQPSTGGIFGGSSGTTSLFGQASGTSAFGGASAGGGGTALAFIPPSGQDTMMKSGVSTNINTRHNCITAMKEYENKSLEELRFEDYGANRKFKQAGSTSAGGIFGQAPTSQASGSGFVFGSGGGLGTGLQSSSAGFGGFGSTSSAATTPFNQNRALFGTATTTQPGFGLGSATGTQQTNSLFGNTAARPLFGTPSTQASLTGGSSFFGAQPGGTSTSIGFGTNTQSGGLFGSKPAGFGTATTSAGIGFGTGNLFAKPASTASAFGFGTNTSTAGFGNTSGGGLFNLKPGGFGNTATGGLSSGSTFGGFGTGLTGGNTSNTFGQTAAKPGGFGGFNFSSGTGAGGFGNTLGAGTGTNTFSGLGGGGGLSLGTTTASLQSNNAQMQQHLLALATSPYGDNPLFWNLKQQIKDRKDDALKPTNPNAQKAVLSSANQYKVSPRPTAKMKPKSLHNLINGGKAQIFDGLEDEDFSFGDDTFVPRKSVKKLVLRKGSGNKSSDSTSFFSEPAGLYNSEGNTVPAPLPITRPLDNNSFQEETNEAEPKVTKPSDSTSSKEPFVQRLFTDNSSLDDSNNSIQHPSPRQDSLPVASRLAADTTTSFLDTSDLDNSCLSPENIPPHPTGIVMSRPGYYCMPTLDEMTGLMDENGNCFVEDFTIGREGYGNLFFPGITNVAGMNIDEIVHFRRKEVVVYPDDDKKPPLGDGLNKKAQITLDCVWPMDKSSRTPVRSPDRLKLINYTEKIEETTSKIGGKFIDYRPETGSWVFEVNHFSKYGLLDDSDEDELTEQQKQLLAGQQNKNLLLVQKLKVQQQQKLLKGQKALAGEEGQGDITSAADSSVPMMTIDGEEENGMGGDEEEEDDDDGSMMLPDEMGAAKTARKYLQDDDDFNTSLDSKYLASAMGVSTQHIQGMKASFFADEFPVTEVGKKMKGEKAVMRAELDDYDEDMQGIWKKGDKNIATSLFGAFKHPASLSLPQSPAFFEKEPYAKEGLDGSFQKSGGLFDTTAKDARPTPQTFLHPPVMEHRLIPSGLKADDVPPRVSTQVRHEFVHPKDSLLYRFQEPLLDSSCFMGQSFRVGWGHAWMLSHCGFPSNYEEEEPPLVSLLPTSQGHTKMHPRSKKLTVQVEQVQMAGYAGLHDITVIDRLKNMLQVHLEHSIMDVEEGCPLIVPKPGVEALHELATTVRADLDEMGSHPDSITQEQMSTVLSLCEALWGNLPDEEDLESKEIYRESQMRREAVSSWINETSSRRVEEEIETNPVSDVEGCLKAVFSKLSVREISSACLLAQRGRDHRLALLLAQSMGSSMTRQLINSQLDKWAELDASQFIAPLRHKIYCLLAGQLVWKSRNREINTCEHLDWKRCLALHLWYKCPPSASIQQALNQYRMGFQGKDSFEPYCTAPLPPYLEKEGLYEGERIYDTAYHLLCLYADKTYGLEALLSPTSSNASHLDFRLSWHLLQILQSLHYSHLSPYHTDSIHSSFASQLEAMGLWDWAAFVLLHIQNGFHRQKAVIELLQRHLYVSDEVTEREKFLVEKLLIPESWLHHAKAIRARHSGDKHAEARHWLLAGHWNNAHQVVLQHIAPDAIINENYDYLREFLKEMASPEHSLAILNWASNGKVFLDFMDIQDRLDQFHDAEPLVSDLEELQPQVISLCGRVKCLACHTAKDYLCQAKMIKSATRLLRNFYTLQKKKLPTSQVLKVLPDLPMPEDYSLQELQALTLAQLTRIV